MSAIASSNSLGLVATSLPLINSTTGPNTGRSGEQLAVNVVNGNLVLQRQDELLIGRALDTAVMRTYNSQGVTDGDNNDNWRIGFYRSLKDLGGAIGAANSSIVRVAADGAELIYKFNGGMYVNTDGDGSYDTLSYDSNTSRWTWTDGDSRVTETYDWSNGSGKLLSEKDVSGNVVSYIYQASGMLQQVLNASGEKTILDYTGTNLTRIRVERADGSQFSRVSYGYDSSNRLQVVTVDLTPDNAQDNIVYTTSYTYDGASKRVRTVTQSDGSAISINYDSSSRVTSITDALGNITGYLYSTGQTTVTDALNNKTVYQYDANGRLGSITAPSTGGVTSIQQFSYNNNGDIVTITDGEGRRVVMQYDGNGNQTLQRDEAGNTVTRTFDSRNRLLTETAYLTPDPDGADPTHTGTAGTPGAPLSTRYAYDTSGRLRFVISPEGRVTEHQYNAAGQRIRSMEYLAGSYAAATATETELSTWAGTTSKAQLQRTDMEYDFRGQLIRATTYSAVDSAGNPSGAAATTYVYDQAGRLLSTVAPLGGSAQTTTYTYDGLDRLLVATNGLGQQTIYSYDDASNKTTLTAANGLKTISTYDKAGRLVSVQQRDAVNADLGTSRYYYDNNHQLRMTEDATGVRTWLLYDAAGRRNGEVDGTGSLTEYVYDRNGQVTQTIRYATPVKAMFSPVMDAEIFTIPSLNPLTLSKVGLTNTAIGSATLVGAFTTATFGVENARKVSSLNVTNPDLFAMRFTGSINVFTAGDYTFYIRSDDGSNLYIDGVLQINNDRAQAVTTLANTVNLSVGSHSLVETYYEWTGDNSNEFGLRVGGADIKAESLVQIEELRPAANASDQKTWNIYDKANRLIEQVAANGAVTEFQYDGQSRLVRTIEYANPIDTTNLGSAPTAAAVVPIADPQNDRVSRNFHDNDGLLRATLDGEGYLVENSYNNLGQLWKTTAYANPTTATLRNSGTLDQLRPASNTDDITTYTLYDAEGDVAAEIDGEGYLTEHVHDANGNETQTRRYASALTATVLGTITATTTLASVRPATASADQEEKATYDALNRAVTTTNAQGTVTFREYNAAGNVTSVTVAHGTTEARTVGMTYDLLGRLTVSTDARGNKALQAYDKADRLVRSTDENGNVTRYYYDQDGRQVYVVNALGEVEGNTYNALGQLVTETRYGTPLAAGTLASLQGGLVDAAITNAVKGIANNAFDSKTSYAYNKDGTVASSSDALGNLTFYSYNAFGEQRGVTIPIATSSNLTSIFAYDRRGLLLSTSADSSGINATSTQTYDAFGRVVQNTDARGNSSSIKYDRQGRQVRLTDALGSVQSTTYDAFDRVRTQTDALGNVTTTSYDSATRTTTMTTPEGVTVRTSTNRHGQVASVVDGRGNTVTYTYDANGNLTQTDLPLQRSGKQAFDKANRLIETADERGIRTVMEYDAADRVLTRTVDPSTASPAYTGLNLVTRYEYDALGRQTRTVDPGGVATVTEYDLNGQVTKQIVDVGTGKLNLTTTTTYDQRGKTLTVTDPAGTKTQYKYDKLGRRTEEVVDPAGLALKTSYGYDRNDNVIIKTVSNPAGDSNTRYAYDANDQLVYTIDPLGYVRENTYDGENQLVKVRIYTRPISVPNLTVTSIDGGSQPAPGITIAPTLSMADIQQALAARVDPQSAADSVERRQYDKDGRLAWTVDAIGAVTRYQYDANGNVVKKTAYANPISPTALATSVIEDASRDQVTLNVYDAANRLSYTIDGLGAVTGYDYDANGNIVKQTAYGLTITPKTLTVSFGKNIISNGATTTTRTIAVNPLPATVIQKTELILSDVVANAGVPVMSVISPMTGVLTPTETSDPGWVQSSLKSEIRVSLSGATTLAATSISNEASPGTVTPNPCILTVPNLSNNGGNVTLSLSETYNNKKYDGTELDDATFGEVRLNLVYTIADYSAASIAIFVARDASRDQVTQYAYDAANRQTRTTYPTVGIYSGESSAALLANGATGLASRVETSSALYTQAYYDASGNVVANRDAAGNMRYQAYDAAGQIRFAVDTEGYVTGYVRDSLGNVTALTRYADKIADATRAAWGSNAPPLATVAALLTNNSANRTIITEYDALGRAVQITEPSIYAYDGTTAFTASPVTRHTYNALGQIIQTQVTKDNSTWLNTYRYYDQRGLEIATIDALRNVTTQRYDAFGNMTERTEYANPLGSTVGISSTTYSLPGASDKDRTTLSTFDQNNRMVSETQVNVEYSGGATGNGVTLYADANYQGSSKSFGVGLYNVSDLGIGNESLSSIKVAPGWQVTLYEHEDFKGGTKVITADNALLSDFNDKTSSIAITASGRGDLTSTYQYDTFGNLIRTTDAGNNSTTTYYDQANRTRAVTEATRAIEVNASFSGLTEFTRDAFGNVIQQIERANGAIGFTLNGYGTISSGNDRINNVKYDSWGRAVESTDALNNVQYMSYDANGNLAKQWQSVNDGDGLTRTSFKAFRYDKLGQLVNTIEPGSYGVSIFSDDNYQGSSRSFTVGDYNLNQLGISNDALSSLGVKQGWTVTLYADSNFTGETRTITANTTLLPDFNNQTSSLRITAPSALAVNNTQMQYNAFGELISKGLVGNDVMWPGDLRANQSIVSANGRYQLVMQPDGNLVTYDLQNNRKVVWKTDTPNNSGSRFAFQANDGNLVIYGADSTSKWAARTQNDPESKGGFLRLQNDGNLVLYNASGSRAIWTSGVGDIMYPGKLKSDQSLISANGRYQLTMQPDGNLVTYDLQNNRKVVWKTDTPNNNGSSFVFQDLDGNLVIYSSTGTALWNAKTQTDPESKSGFLRLENDGNLVLYTASGSRAIWSSGVGDIMRPGKLKTDQSIVSANGRYQLIMQSDGNLITYDLQNNRQSIWSGGTFNNTGASFSFQANDGNLVIYNAVNNPVWNAGTQNDPASKNGFLRLQNDGNLVLCAADGSRAIWSSRTGLNVSALKPDPMVSIRPATIQGDAQSEYFEYNNGGQLWRSNSGDGVSKVMLYDLQGNLTAEIRSATTDLKTMQSSAASVNALTGTRRAQNTYDALGRLTQQKLANGATVNQTFDRWSNRLSISDAGDASGITEYSYNAGNQLIQEIRPTINALKNDLSGYADQRPITQYFYDYAGNQTAVRDARGNVNRKTYDVKGNVIQELNADGSIVQHSYNAFGNEVRRTDAMSNVTQYEYNKLGQLNKIIRPGADYYQLISGSDDGTSAETQAPVTLYYDSNYGGKVRYFGEGTWEGLEKEISSLKVRAGWKVTLYDDDSGIDGGAQNQDYTTDQSSLPSDLNDDVKKISVVRIAGRTARTEAASAPSISLTYDALGRQLSKSDGNGNTQYTFDASGNVVNIRLPGDITVMNQYDASNRKITETNANGDLATWNYDYFGRLISKADIGGASYSYAYDYAGQLIRETNSRGRDVTTTYETSGQVKKIEDKTSASAKRTTEYEYNSIGQHTNERVSIDGIVYSDQELRYDSLGQLAYAGKPNADVYYQYDLVGNRVKITNFIDQDTIYFYAYDAMNRQVMVDGVTNNDVNNSANYNSSAGRKITYDKNGNRISDAMQNSTERYSYDTLNRLYKATKNDVTVRYIRFDQAGRELEVFENSLAGQTDMNAYTNVYDTGGRLVRQYFRNDSTIDQNNMISWGKDSAAMFNTYDRLGNITKSTRQLYGIDQWTTTSDYGYAKFDSYKQNQITSTRSDNTSNPGKTTLTYDLNGHLVNIDDEDKDENDRSFVNNADGQILQKTQQSKTLRNFFVNGQVLGTYGTGIDQDKPPVVSKVKVAITLYVITQVDVGSTSEFHITFKAGDKQEYREINDVANDSQQYSTVMGVSWPPIGGNLEVSVSGVEHDGSSANDALPTASFTVSAGSWIREGQEFTSVTVENGHAKYYIKFKIFTDQTTVDYNDTVKNFGTYQIVDAANSGAGSSNYRVGAGDSLQSIAQGAYGDAALWYLIADANGLRSNSTLQVGTMLTLPNAVGTVHNNANTFKPYNSSNIIGDTSPYLAEPPGISKCQQIGTIIAAVLAALVISLLATAATVFTLGAAGVPALSGAGIAIAAIIGAVGGAAGSAASQGIMTAGGLQEHFSWSDVGVGAATGLVTGAIMGGVGAAGKAAAVAAKNLQRLGFAQKMLLASLKCVGSKGISYATVAQSAIIKSAGFAAMGMVNNALGQGIKIAAGEQKSFQWNQIAASAVTGAFSGAGGATGGVVGGIVGDIGGAALGNVITNDGKFDATQFVGEVAGSIGGAIMGGMMERICFAAGTPVHTEQGLKPIESFIGGEMVLTRHEQTGEIAYRRVARTFVTPDQKIFRLVVVDTEERTETLRTTAEHPFWIKDRGWMKAGMLKAGDVLIGRSDETVTVYSAALETTMETVYNIEVEDFHTYHVGKAGVWVHNTCEGVIGKVGRFLKKPRYSRADFNMLPESCIESTEFVLQTQQSGRKGMRYGEKADPVYMLFKHPTEEKTVYFDLSNDADIQDHAQGLRNYLSDKELPGIGEGIALLNRTNSDFRKSDSYNMHLGAVLKRNEKSAWISDMSAFVESDFPMRDVQKINITKAGDFRGDLYKSHEKYAMGLVTNNLPQNAVHAMPPDLQSPPPAKRQRT